MLNNYVVHSIPGIPDTVFSFINAMNDEKKEQKEREDEGQKKRSDHYLLLF